LAPVDDHGVKQSEQHAVDEVKENPDEPPAWAIARGVADASLGKVELADAEYGLEPLTGEEHDVATNKTGEPRPSQLELVSGGVSS
jgi:hypothetical protein